MPLVNAISLMDIVRLSTSEVDQLFQEMAVSAYLCGSTLYSRIERCQTLCLCLIKYVVHDSPWSMLWSLLCFKSALSMHIICIYCFNNTGAVAWLPHDVIKWKHFPHYWSFARGIHRSPVNYPHNGQWRGALVFSLICAWTNGWDAG